MDYDEKRKIIKLHSNLLKIHNLLNELPLDQASKNPISELLFDSRKITLKLQK